MRLLNYNSSMVASRRAFQRSLTRRTANRADAALAPLHPSRSDGLLYAVLLLGRFFFVSMIVTVLMMFDVAHERLALDRHVQTGLGVGACRTMLRIARLQTSYIGTIDCPPGMLAAGRRNRHLLGLASHEQIHRQSFRSAVARLFGRGIEQVNGHAIEQFRRGSSRRDTPRFAQLDQIALVWAFLGVLV